MFIKKNIYYIKYYYLIYIFKYIEIEYIYFDILSK